jgi:hypothetical protein
VPLHIDAHTAEGHAFGRKAGTLLEAGAAWEADVPSGSDYAVPRKTALAVVQRPDHLPRGSRVAGHSRNLPVSGYFPARDLPYSFP